MTNKSLRRVWFFGLSLSSRCARLLQRTGTCGRQCWWRQERIRLGSSYGTQNTTSINLNPGGTSTNVSTGTEITEGATV